MPAETEISMNCRLLDNTDLKETVISSWKKKSHNVKIKKKGNEELMR